jgi:hypothetical protein
VRYADWAEEIPRAYIMTGKTYDSVRLNGYPASNRAAAKRELAFALPTLSLLTKLAPNPTDHDLFFVRHGEADHDPLLQQPLTQGSVVR